jgi:SIR2-like domain
MNQDNAIITIEPPDPPDEASQERPAGATPFQTDNLHDLIHLISDLREVLQSEKRRVGFFMGAGCPLGIYDQEGRASVKHIPDVAGLTTSVAERLALNELHFKQWTTLIGMCGGETSNAGVNCARTPNVEHVLTELRTICSLSGGHNVGELEPKLLTELEAVICSHISSIVGKELPSYPTSYHRFTSWLGQIRRDHPVEIFTPNYDLLLEQALEHSRLPYFDGFVGSREPFFDLPSMEQDIVPSRWIRLWKLHGSINWVRRSDGLVYRCHPAPEGRQLLIYPSHLKYDQSRRMPYLAMLDRLRAFLRHPHPLLVIVGYSFSDEHLNDVLLDGLATNQSAHCFALMYGGLADSQTAVSHALSRPNLSVLAFDGAVVGGRCGGYRLIDEQEPSVGAGFFVVSSEEAKNKLTPSRTRFTLGDFHHLSLFFETRFSAYSN